MVIHVQIEDCLRKTLKNLISSTPLTAQVYFSFIF